MSNPVVKKSLTTQPSNTPRTDAARISAWGEGGIAGSIGFSAIPVEFCRELERELAAAIAQRDKARNEALELAAQVCEQPTDEIQISDDRSTYLYKDWYDCAAAIRAVKGCGE
jgi:hypothetical protein